MRPQIAYADSSGTCGTSLTWTFTSATGKLTISGTGAMYNYDTYNSMPWYSFKTSITSLTINPGVTSIGNYAFGDCYYLTGNLTIPAGVTSIGDRAFYNCLALTGPLTIPASMKSIGGRAFASCSALTGALTIPAGVESIGTYAFYGCSSLTGEVTIPASVTGIDSLAFVSIGSTAINVNAGNVNYASVDGILYNKALTTLIQCPAGKTAVFTSLNIPESATSIGVYAFYNCVGLTGDLTIPETVTNIGERAFYSCKGFTGKLTIPTGVTVINSNTFYSCNNLTGSLIIPSGVTSIGGYAFVSCRGFTGELIIPEGVTNIGDAVFASCNQLTGGVTIPTGVTSIGATTFSGCSKLASITIHDGVTTIGEQAFRDSSSAFVINCHYGSVAETYAQNNSLKYNNLYDAEISGVSVGSYTGEAVTQPSLTVAAKTFANPEGITITEDEDYTVSYSDNIDVGTATITIAGMGNYVGTASKSFKISDVLKVVLTPDSLSKNAGEEGHIDVSFDDATSYDAYALAIPMLFDKDTIEITALETVDFTAKGLAGLVFNDTPAGNARYYDSSSEVLSVINADGKFLLSWAVKEETPHTLTEDVYFRIHYRVKKNLPTGVGFAIGEYNVDNGIDQDQLFGVDGLGILCSNQDDFGAYLLVGGESGILTQEYISITVEDMLAVTINGDVNSISLQGRAMLTGKQRTAISAIGYTPDLSLMDAGIRVEMYEVDNAGEIVKQVGSVAYAEAMDITAAVKDPASTLYNYTLKISRIVVNDLTNSDPGGSDPKYMLRFSRFDNDGGSAVGTVREESYLWADIYLDGTGVISGAIDEDMPLTVGGTAYLYAGAFYLPGVEKTSISVADLSTIKGQVGNADIEGVTTIYNINEYLGVDAADYTTVLRYIGKTKLQPIPLAVTN